MALAAASVTFFAVSFAMGRAEAAEYYVAPTGSDSNPGTMASPFATLQKGGDMAAAGDTVWLRGGTYQVARQIKLSKSGQSDTQRIKYWAYQKEVPVFDFSGYTTTNSASDQPQILVTGSWIHMRGLEIANGKVGASGAHSNSALRSNGGSNNTYELLNIHHNFGPGLFIDTGTGGNLILNCDSHDNYDKNGSQGDGQNGDGFGVHYQTTGPSTIIRGCRAWINSDDGYDLISQEVPVTIENSWAIQDGYASGGSVSPSSGNGNGFKVGSSKNGIRHIVRNCVAWKNKAAGYYANHSSGGNTWYNNTAYMNKTQYNMLASSFDASGSVTGTITLTGSKAHIMRNNIGFPNNNSNMGGVDSMNNTWDLNISEAGSDFASTSDTGATGPRQADGSLPAIDFLKLKAGSPLIDKGTNVMLPFVGAAPDLGAYEYGAVTNAGSGGSSVSGSGGSTNGSGGGAAPDGGATGGLTGASGGAVGTGGSISAGTGGTSTVNGTGGSAQASGGSNATGTGGASTGSGTGGAAGNGNGEISPGGSAGCACTIDARASRDQMALLLVVVALGLVSTRRRNRLSVARSAPERAGINPNWPPTGEPVPPVGQEPRSRPSPTATTESPTRSRFCR